MANKSQKYIKEYRSLRNEIDSEVKILEKEHESHMKCEAGCDVCCMDYGILPVEFFSVLDELKMLTKALPSEWGGQKKAGARSAFKNKKSRLFQACFFYF